MALNIAIVGGGPGGLMTAWHMRRKFGNGAHVSIFEASERLGGKILTQSFSSDPKVIYEAGAAEFYGYSSLGEDPLLELIESFGLKTTPMESDFVQIDGEMLDGVKGMRARYGDKTANAILAFRRQCASQLSPAEYYEGSSTDDNEHDWSEPTAEQILNSEIKDATARKFFRVMARSDIASEMHLTNGLNALKNYLMDVDGYIDVYSIDGGNQRLVDNLVADLDADVHLRARLLGLAACEHGYRLRLLTPAGQETRDFDLVIICLPHNWLGTVEWQDEALRQAMTKHIAHFDRPAHYLRVAAMFERPFWEGKVDGAWWMTEAFGGACVYIENARHPAGGRGVLNWLIPGADALAYVNLDDKALIDVALGTLPKEFGDAKALLMEARVHRWIASVNALPGGLPVRDEEVNHRPAPQSHPGVFVVGDYLFDSTLNGLLDSADIASDMALEEAQRMAAPAAKVRQA
ncbi:MAG: FAD-dependent oxidoreductase [Hyphomicrobiales bacterium]|nr:FAD-dependent oxidoreductase [Hyphomicrobiales bacterium]